MAGTGLVTASESRPLVPGKLRRVSASAPQSAKHTSGERSLGCVQARARRARPAAARRSSRGGRRSSREGLRRSRRPSGPGPPAPRRRRRWQMASATAPAPAPRAAPASAPATAPQRRRRCPAPPRRPRRPRRGRPPSLWWCPSAAMACGACAQMRTFAHSCSACLLVAAAGLLASLVGVPRMLSAHTGPARPGSAAAVSCYMPSQVAFACVAASTWRAGRPPPACRRAQRSGRPALLQGPSIQW